MYISIEEMLEKSSPAKVITKVPKKKGVTLPKLSPLYEFEFYKKDFITKNKKYFCFYDEKCIFFKDKSCSEIKGVCFYDFNLRVEVLYHSGKSNLKLCDLIYGFKLIRSSQTMQIQTDSKEICQTLLPYFRERLNLSNFHILYKAVKKIGKGNFASVYLVDSTQNGKSYAVKAFSKELAFEEEKGKNSLINEIKIMRSISHTNLIALEEVHETDNSIYMVLELLEGGNLVDYLKQHGRFNEKEAAIFLRAILRGISHMHSKNIMHRDLKPENILFRNNYLIEDNICIVDFGLSTHVDDEYLFVRCGTPGFVAPEVINLKDLTKKYDKVCDIFSVGIIFHILLYGKSVFPGKTYNDILTQNRACNFNFEDLIYQKISPIAKDLLLRLLEIEPDKRITADLALQHAFLCDKPEKISDFSEEEYNIQAEEGHALSLKEAGSKHEGVSASLSPYLPQKSSYFSPLGKYQNLNISSPLKSSEEGGYLVSRHPILNGYTKTFENLGSNSLEFNTYQKKNKLDEMQSPELKRSLQENKQSKEFNIKNSLYAISKIEEEERKEI